MSNVDKQVKYDLRKSYNWTNAAANNLEKLDTSDPSLMTARANAIELLRRAMLFIEEVRYLYEHPFTAVSEDDDGFIGEPDTIHLT